MNFYKSNRKISLRKLLVKEGPANTQQEFYKMNGIKVKIQK